MTAGEKIRKFRIDQGYTQKELAIMSGLSESAKKTTMTRTMSRLNHFHIGIPHFNFSLLTSIVL